MVIINECECNNWARDRIVLLTTHHPNCPKYDVESEARIIIDGLLKGIISWANDEDGIHPDCFEAFKKAACFTGQPGLVKND